MSLLWYCIYKTMAQSDLESPQFPQFCWFMVDAEKHAGVMSYILSCDINYDRTVMLDIMYPRDLGHTTVF